MLIQIQEPQNITKTEAVGSSRATHNEPDRPSHAPIFSQEIGIDLGTTYTVVSCVGPRGTPIILSLPFGTLTPSRVGLDAKGALHVVGGELGEPSSTSHVFSSTKRAFDQPHTPMCGSTHTPTDIARCIIDYVKHQAEQILQKPVSHAVITVPAYFDDIARAATKQAAQDAGLTVMRLIAEPTAAALSYGLDARDDGVYAVFDLGGGTFDVSLLRLCNHVFQVVATGGDMRLGGDDVDQAIAEFLTCSQSDARILKEGLAEHEIMHHGDFTLNRADLERLCAPLIEKALIICRQVVRDAGMTLRDVDGVILVGGSTRLQSVRDAVTQFFKKEPHTGINPDECVAAGAALHAHSLIGQYGALTLSSVTDESTASPHLLLDVTPLSQGVETLGGIVDTIIPRNTPIPCHMAQDFTTAVDDQKAIVFHVVQGEGDDVSQCRSLGRFTLSHLPSGRAHSVRVRVSFQLDESGLLTVSASDEGGNVQASLSIHHDESV